MQTTTSFGAREIIALFVDENELNDAIEDLEIDGFERSDISVSPPWKRAERQFGHELESAVELATALDAPHRSPVDRAFFGVAQGACIAGPLYVFSRGATRVGFVGAHRRPVLRAVRPHNFRASRGARCAQQQHRCLTFRRYTK